MSDARAKILGRVKTALAPLAERAPLAFRDEVIASAQSGRALSDWALFADRFTAVRGLVLDNGEALRNLFVQNGWKRGYVAPALREDLRPWLPGNIEVETEFRRDTVDTYEFGITEAAGAVAETGTVIIADQGAPHRLATVAPWAHIAVLRRSSVVRTVQAALRSLPADPNIVWVTGPSKTADVEGILIEGVHGPGLQAVLCVDSR